MCYCKGCNKKDGGKCNTCLQKPKFGGGGKGSGSNKRCLAKYCLKKPESAKNENLQQNSIMVKTNMVMFAKSCKSERCNQADCGNCNVCCHNHNITMGNSSGSKLRCLAKETF